jgi:hypothetical protein
MTMTKTVLIEDWAVGPNGLDYPKTKKQLAHLAKTNQIYPPAMRDGWKWVVYEDAKFVGIQGGHKISKNIPEAARAIVERTLNGKTTRTQR